MGDKVLKVDSGTQDAVVKKTINVGPHPAYT